MFGLGLAYWAPPCLRFCVCESFHDIVWDASPSHISLKHISAVYYDGQRRHKLGQKEIPGHGPNVQAFFLLP